LLAEGDGGQQAVGEQLIVLARRERERFFPVVEDYARFEREVESLRSAG
jgi:hypothetical protein